MKKSYNSLKTLFTVLPLLLILCSLKNPSEVKKPNVPFSCKKEIVFGDQKDNRCIFALIGEIAVDDSGNLFAFDPKQLHIKKFSKDGKLIRIFGRKGQGPGEFSSINSIQIDGDKLFVYDQNGMRISYFSLNGEFIETILVNVQNLISLKKATSNSFLGSTVKLTQNNFAISSLDFFDEKMNFIRTLHKSQPQNIFNPFHSYFIWTLHNSGCLAVGFNENYELFFYNDRLELVRKFTHDFHPVKIPEDVKKERMKNYQGLNVSTPESYPAFHGIFMDDQRRIFVKTWQKGENRDGFIHDVFNWHGEYLGSVPLPGRNHLIRNGKMYCVEADREENIVLARYLFSDKK